MLSTSQPDLLVPPIPEDFSDAYQPEPQNVQYPRALPLKGVNAEGAPRVEVEHRWVPDYDDADRGTRKIFRGDNYPFPAVVKQTDLNYPFPRPLRIPGMGG